ncbi:hypothetical protein AOCH_003209 [Aspergillus ochraceoroseus]|uniref:Mitochondrial pyruvate carrier n=1 Tax=Aspergillus ochraceoroseus TaxID=138278 RepID=A0A0F8WWC4_9EURO|nr:hypothetical protein AOCH_003209 [Aspergillus ochraceoroseus]
MSSPRVGLRFFQNSRAAFRSAFRRPGAQGRRFQTSDATAEQQSTFQRIWNSPVGVKTVHFWYGPRDEGTHIIATILQRRFASPTKQRPSSLDRAALLICTILIPAFYLNTVALVIAGISDLSRPAEKLSLTQNGALMATGAIWTRWCLIITPKNYLLAAVNFFLGCVGVAQVTRIFLYHRSLEGSSKEAVKDMEHEVADAAKAAATKAGEIVKKSA